MEQNLTLLVVLLWLGCGLFSFLNGLVRQLHIWQWLLISLLFGPLALVLGLFLTGQGYRASIFEKRAPDDEPRPFRVPSDEELLSGKVAFKAEILELKRTGRLPEAESMLETLIDVVEEKARLQGRGVPHWYYEQLANLYRKQKKAKAEIRVLKRWQRQEHAPKPKAEKRLASRLAKLTGSTR